jgi:hypothetical protein
VDLSRIKRIETDDSLLDEEGHPRKDALIFEDKIVCHPDMAEHVQIGVKFFNGITLRITQK